MRALSVFTGSVVLGLAFAGNVAAQRGGAQGRHRTVYRWFLYNGQDPGARLPQARWREDLVQQQHHLGRGLTRRDRGSRTRGNGCSLRGEREGLDQGSTQRCDRPVHRRQLHYREDPSTRLPQARWREDLVRPGRRRCRNLGSRRDGCSGSTHSIGARGNAVAIGFYPGLHTGHDARAGARQSERCLGQPLDQGIPLPGHEVLRHDQAREVHVGGRREGGGVPSFVRKDLQLSSYLCRHERGRHPPPFSRPAVVSASASLHELTVMPA